jgi:hypothetical protein
MSKKSSSKKNNQLQLIDLIKRLSIKIKMNQIGDGDDGYITMEMKLLCIGNLLKGDVLVFNKNEYDVTWDNFIDSKEKKKFTKYMNNSAEYMNVFIQITDRFFYGSHLELQAEIIPPDGEFYNL